MPIYKITDSETNQTLRIEGDAPPTEADIENIFADYKTPVKESSVELEEQPSEPVQEKPELKPISWFDEFVPSVAVTVTV